MEYRLLGPVEVEREGRVLPLGGPKQRAVLAILLMRRGSSIPSDVLIDELWGESAPATARNALQGYVFQLRKVLEPDVGRGQGHRILVSDGAGYRIDTQPDELDVQRFERLTGEGRKLVQTSPAAAAARFDEALALWRGPPLADLVFEQFAQAEAHRLDELRLATQEDRIDALLAAGRHGEVVGEIEALIESNPLRERLRRQLLLALYRCDRQSDALAAYAGARDELVEQLGIEPGPELRELHVAILNQDPALAAPQPPATAALRSPPRPATQIHGREATIAEVVELLRRYRLVTLVGPGGIGKTRLALAIAEAAKSDFPEGVAWVALEAVDEAALVLPEVADAAGASGDLAAELAGRRILLVLDNVEQVLDCASALADLLAHTSDLRMLATSREPLDIGAERRFQVPLLEREAAIELFADRADAVGTAIGDEAGAVAAICDRLECLPLAVELAAARTAAFSAPELLSLLDARPGVLDGTRRDAPDRHHTLRATIDWSYELLGESERALFRQLSVFAGGCTLTSAQAVLAASAEAAESLVLKSLLRSEDGRLRMLATIRDDALERLEQADEADLYREAHARHYLEVTTEADEQLVGPDQAEALARLAQEQDNIRAALSWAGGANADLLAELVAAAAWFWFMRGQLEEGGRWLEDALSAGVGDPALRATLSMRAGAIADARGEYDRAEAHYRSALELRRAGRDLPGAVSALNNLGALAYARADLPAALAWYEQGLALARDIDDQLGVAIALGNMGIVAVAQGDCAAAVGLLEQSIALGEQLGHQYVLAVSRQALGSAHLGLGNLDQASAHLMWALSMHRKLEELIGIAPTLEELAGLAVALGAGEDAAARLGAASAIRESMGTPLPAVEESRHARTVAAARALVGDERYEELYRDGLATDPGAAVEAALATTPSPAG